ncbi:MAG: YkgJ family cysteine cluster protein [Chthoniobacterales bacterium]
MLPEERLIDSAASRLCNSCGLCCDGTLFPTVRLQPTDSAQELKAHGILIHYKKKYDFFEQPCSCLEKKEEKNKFLFTSNQYTRTCSIYADRPTRCRLFECQQLKRLAAAETTEEAVLGKINEAHQKIELCKSLLWLSGKTNPKKQLTKQYQKIIAEPILAGEETEKIALRKKLELAFQELEIFLDQEFRKI